VASIFYLSKIINSSSYSSVAVFLLSNQNSQQCYFSISLS